MRRDQHGQGSWARVRGGAFDVEAHAHDRAAVAERGAHDLHDVIAGPADGAHLHGGKARFDTPLADPGVCGARTSRAFGPSAWT